jgi:hypothetical protein
MIGVPMNLPDKALKYYSQYCINKVLVINDVYKKKFESAEKDSAQRRH